MGPLFHQYRCRFDFTLRFQWGHVFAHPAQCVRARADVQPLPGLRHRAADAVEAVLDVHAARPVLPDRGAVLGVALPRQRLRSAVLCQDPHGYVHDVHAGALWAFLL